MKVPILDLKRQYAAIRAEIEPRVLECMAGGQYIMGENIRALEKELAEYLGVRNAVTVGNGTDALTIALRAAGVRAGDEVITTPFSYIATADTVAALGARPVFADIVPGTLNLDPAAAEKKITPKTRALLPVHIFGQPARMDELRALAEKHGLALIEDACQAIGSEYRGKKAGTLGTFGCFSFFPTKNLGAFGDAGMIATDDDRLATVCRALREHGGGKNGAAARDILDGREPAVDDAPVDPMYNPYKYFNYLIGYNSRMDELQAAVLRVKLRHLDDWNRRRAENAEYYLENLKNCGVSLPEEEPGTRPVWHQFCIRTPYKKELGAFLREKGVGTGVFYPVPLHLQKAFEFLGGREGDLPAVERAAKETLCLPVFPELTKEELCYVVDCIKEFRPEK